MESILSEIKGKTRIMFGPGMIQKLHNQIPQSTRNVLVVTGKWATEKHGQLSLVLNQINQTNASAYVFNHISPNPTVLEVDAGVEFARLNKIDLVIGLGGGSAMDAAKAIAAIFYTNEETSRILIGKGKLTDVRLPLIQIPTTAGTGSELSMGAILSDHNFGIKDGLRGEVLLADIALVDPELTLSVPLDISQETGFDILTHAIETYLSRKSSSTTRFLSIEAYKRVVKWLPKLQKDLHNIEARAELSYASMLMGINLANSSTCLPHRLQYPIGALTNSTHPRGLAAIYPAWLKYTLLYNPEGMRNFALDANFPESNSEPLENQLLNSILSLLKEINMDLNLRDLGVSDVDLEIVASNVRGSLANDPIGSIDGIVKKIYMDSL